jgi:hypothetical protein
MGTGFKGIDICPAANKRKTPRTILIDSDRTLSKLLAIAVFRLIFLSSRDTSFLDLRVYRVKPSESLKEDQKILGNK